MEKKIALLGALMKYQKETSMSRPLNPMTWKYVKTPGILLEQIALNSSKISPRCLKDFILLNRDTAQI